MYPSFSQMRENLEETPLDHPVQVMGGHSPDLNETKKKKKSST